MTQWWPFGELACALRLKRSGEQVQVFDKGRGPGGRMSTRRMQTPLGEIRWDHGAQFFTARSDAFQEAVRSWQEVGAVAEWSGKFLTLGQSDNSASKDDTKYVGAPGMNGVIRYMANEMDVAWGRRAQTISGEPGNWDIGFEDGPSEQGFEKVVVAVPAEQASDLFRTLAPSFAEEASSVTSAPCWAVLLAYDAPLDAGFDAAKISNGPLSWIARNSSKPGRDDAEAWVLHASPEWSSAGSGFQRGASLALCDGRAWHRNALPLGCSLAHRHVR